ncbi:eukaryotic translation initiation factor 4 gamma-like [Lathyrus oleraceus]|uniref:eukaryotic translation initiation factor 4 gamma-like n=1 Tax=Pisum sativum TaxID=3888 RepID=UPI0021D3022F|nr:eukaryotic translation initiation factor 4 gamma-like [Pisum sativum]
MKRMREPYEKSKKAKKARLGESSRSRPPVPLAGSPSLSEQVRNNFIRDAGIRLQERLAKEAEERARKEAEEKPRQEEEQRIWKNKEKVVADVAAAAEAEAKAKVDAEEVARIAEEAAAKVNADALTRGEQSNSGFTSSEHVTEKKYGFGKKLFLEGNNEPPKTVLERNNESNDNKHS